MTLPPFISDLLKPKKELFTPKQFREVALSFKQAGWSHLGRDHSGVDCIGLGIAIYREFGIDLSGPDTHVYDVNFWRDRKQRNRLRDGLLSRFDLVPQIAGVKVGNILVFSFGRVEAHVGFYLGNSEFIHCEEATGVQVTSFRHPIWSKQFSRQGKLKAELET